MIRNGLDSLRQDLNYSIRTLAKQRSLSLIIIVMLALGIGANTAIFSVVNGVLLKPLPFPEVDRLVHVWEDYPKGARYQWGSPGGYIIVRPATFFDWKRQSSSFQDISAYGWRSVSLNVDKPEVLHAHEVDDRFFATVGVKPQLGRTFQPDDYASGRRAVILSHTLWKTRFGSDPAIVGKQVALDKTAHMVVGVMPEGFYPTRWETPLLWLPLHLDPVLKNSRVQWKLFTFARLKPGVSFDQAQREMDVISDRLTAAYPSDYDNMSAVLTPVNGYLFSQYEKLFYTLLGAVGLVLLIACANVANLLLARVIEREREFSVRAALGASIARLLRQLLTESLLLSGAGAILGVLLARLALRPILALLPATSRLPRIDHITLDGSVLLFTAGLSVFAGLLFGTLPALRASRTDLNANLKEGGRTGSAGLGAKRIGDLLVIAEMAVSLVLLVGAGLLVQSFVRLMKSDPGFRRDNIVAMYFDVPAHRYGKYETGGANLSRVRLYEGLERNLASLPGVKNAVITSQLPLRHGANPWSMHIVGKPAPPRDSKGYGGADRVKQTGLYNHGSVSIERVTPGYFDAFGISVLRGRSFNSRDNATGPKVAMINEMNARRYFGKEDPIGKTIILDMTSYFPRVTIVGVVANSRLNALDKEAIPVVFWPLSQWPGQSGWAVVRSAADPRSVTQAAQSAIHKLDPEIAITEVTTMNEVTGDSLWRQRMTAILLSTLGGLALLLAGAGIYGVFSYLVNRRVKELGVRIALGATKIQILQLVLGSAMRLALTGLALGLVIWFLASRLVSTWLYGVRLNDVPTISSAFFLLLLIALLACYVPARRAIRIDPAVALRDQ